MKPKRRIERVMNLEIPDRIPFDGGYPWNSDILYAPIGPGKQWQPPDKPGYYPQVEYFIKKLGYWRWKPKNWQPPKNWKQLKRNQYDDFGCIWEYTLDDLTKGHPAGSPLETWDLLDTWKFPDPYDSTRYKFSQIRHLFPRKYVVGILDSFLFARVQYLRGFMQTMMDLIRSTSEVKALIEKLTYYFMGAVEMWAKAGADAVFTMDDMGAQNDLFFSPRLYKTLILPALKEIVTRTHELDMKFILHSCGHVNDLIPMWIEAGVDALQFDSPHMTGLDFDKQFVGKIGFHVVPDIQQIYPFVSPTELEEDVKAMICLLGQEGGLMIKDYDEAHKVLKVPIENVKALPKIVKKWGKYPLAWC